MTAGFSARFTGFPQAQAQLQRLKDAGQNLDGPLKAIGDSLTASTRHRFTTHTGPDGEPWAAVSPKYARRKAAGKATQNPGDARTRNPGDLLVLTGQLIGGINYAVQSETLRIGSPDVYAPVHQFGWPGRNIPARPFIGVSEADLKLIRATIDDHLEAAAEG